MADMMRADEASLEPWANGLGRTRVLLTGDGWRVSLATIGAEAPFSPLPGVERVQVPLEPVIFTLNGISRLVEPWTLVMFSGQDRVSARSAATWSLAINVMLTGSVPRVSVQDGRARVEAVPTGTVAVTVQFPGDIPTSPLLERITTTTLVCGEAFDVPDGSRAVVLDLP